MRPRRMNEVRQDCAISMRGAPSRAMPRAAQWLLVAALGMLISGCAAPGPTQKQAAETAWKDQRARLKSELASAELSKGRPDEALSLAQTAVGLSPNDAAHAELLARVYMAKGDFAAARDVLHAAQRAAPGAASIPYLLGTIHEREQRWDAAVEAFRTAVRLGPDLLAYRLALAAGLSQCGDVRGAIATLPAEDARFDGEPGYHAARAELQRQAGDLDAACAAYQRALQLGSDDPATRQSLGLCLFWLGRHADALPYLESAARSSERVDPAAMTAYASALLATGEPERAAEWLARFTNVRPEMGELWVLLAQARLAKNDVVGAVQAGDRALTLLPRSREALCVAAAVRLAAGQLDRAAACVARAMEIEPENAEVLLLHGRVCEQQGHKSDARKAYRAALAANPGDELARELLAGVVE